MRRILSVSAVICVIGILCAGCSNDSSVPLGGAAPTATATSPPTSTEAPTATPTSSPTVTPTEAPTIRPDAIRIIAPEEGATITTFSFSVEIAIEDEAIDRSSLRVTLNDAPIAVSGGPDTFSATINPGPPLLDDNELLVSAATLGGSSTIEQRRSFAYLPPKARARRISDPADLMSGPLADGRVGDYLLANVAARFIVQDGGKRDLYSVGQYGGNIIDAELVGRPGLDNFLEISPSINIETVINAQNVEIINDGQDGTAAIIRTCGPDDTLDFVNPSTIVEDAGLLFPASANDVDYDVIGCTEYALEPGKTYVRMTTTIINNEPEARGFFVGDYLNAAGEVEQWTSSGAGLGEVLTGVQGVVSFFGYGEATGVDYHHTTIPVESSSIPESSFFGTSGVVFVLQSHSVLQAIFGMPPTFIVPANGSKSFTRFFGVGDGSGGNAIDVENEVHGVPSGALMGCVTVGGEPAPASRVSVGTVNPEGQIRTVVSHFVTDENGCFEGTLPVGTYGVAGERRGALYEGGGSRPTVHMVSITEGGQVTQDISLPATGRLHVTVVDESEEPVPGRVTVVGFDPSPEPILVTPGALGMDRTGVFNDIKDVNPFGVVRTVYTDAQGRAEIDLEPGNYQIFVSRGTEYSLFETPATITAGETTSIAAQIARVLDTAGFISSDYHVHGINSADSRVSHFDRVQQFAGEGVDNIIMTDHHAHTDLNPLIDELGFTEFVHSTIGEEITTWDYGHFNAYPMTIDPNRPSGGSTDWGGAAPPGEDFTSLGAFSLTPAEIAALATEGPQSTPDTTIQINHINSFFAPLQIDTSLVPPQSFISPQNKLRFRLDPESGNLFHHFPALELWNGASRGAQREFLEDRIGIWFNHLNQGLLTTAIADTDTHTFTDLRTAGARTWTAAPSDDPEEIDGGQVAQAVDAGRAVGGQGLYVQTRLLAADGLGNAADLTLSGSTIVTTTNGGVDLEIKVQSPTWADYDRIEIYANASTVVTGMTRETPTLFSAEPTLVFQAGTDFEISTIEVFPGVAGGQRRETTLTVPFRDLTNDTWFVVVVKGSDGVSRPMFPVMAQNLNSDSNGTLEDLLDGNVGEGGVLALGFTNALYADVDGVPGFQAPMAP
jgi:hypothetical protein